MITKQFIKNLKVEIEKSDLGRSKIVRETGGIIRESKHAIFKLHRGEVKQAGKDLHVVGKKLKILVKQAEVSGLRNEGSLKAGIEEFLEATFLLQVLQNKAISSKVGFGVKADEQLAALADLTGELVRAATLEVTKGNFDLIQQFRDATEELFGALLQLNIRGTLRSKRDDARRNLKRLEEILYDVSLNS